MPKKKSPRRKRYAAEFKAEAVRLVAERGDRTVAEVAHSLGVPDGQVGVEEAVNSIDAARQSSVSSTGDTCLLATNCLIAEAGAKARSSYFIASALPTSWCKPRLSDADGVNPRTRRAAR